MSHRFFFVLGALILSFALLSAWKSGAALSTTEITLFSVWTYSLLFFFLSFGIAVISVLAGIGGGILFTPMMLAFTDADSLLIRSTGLIVAMFSGLISSGPFMKSGIANLRVSIVLSSLFIIGTLIGANGAVFLSKISGQSGEALLRIALGLIVLAIAFHYIFSSKKIEWPISHSSDYLTEKLNLRLPYHEKSNGKIISYHIQNIASGSFLMLIIGLISGFFGVGGGWAIVPIQNLLMAIPLKVACANSGIIIGMGDCVAIWPYLISGAVIPLFAAPWLAGQVFGGIAGAKFLSHIKASKIRFILIGIMLFTAFSLIIKGFALYKIFSSLPLALYLFAFLSATLISVSAFIFSNRKNKAQAQGDETYKDIEPDTALQIPKPQLVYGKIVYFLTLVSAYIAAIGTFFALLEPEKNILAPAKTFFKIFNGSKIAEIWSESIFTCFPGLNFYFQYPFCGDSLIQIGTLAGCVSAAAGLLVASFAFLKEKDIIFSLLSLWIVIVTVFSISGIINLH